MNSISNCRSTMRALTFSLAIAATGLVGAPLSAQLPSASAIDLGFGVSPVADATHARAISINPAGLGVSSGFSFSLLPVTSASGLDPISTADLTEYGGQLIPASVKERWLGQIDDAGAQQGSFDLGLAGFALTAGNVGVQLSTTAGGAVWLTPDAVELVLFGNAGRTGQARDLDLSGSTLDAFALSTLAVSYGTTVREGVSVGVTGKYHIGHGLLVGRDLGSQASADPLAIDVDLPILLPLEGAGIGDGGSGIGLDVGARIERGVWTFAGTARNLINTFSWDVDALGYRPCTALFNDKSSEVDFDERSSAEAPAVLTEVVEGATIGPEVALGATWQGIERVKLTANLQQRFGEGLAFGPAFSAGVGAEYALAPWLPVRAHAAAISGGVQVGGGASLNLGPVGVTSAFGIRRGDDIDQLLGAFSFTLGIR